MSEDVKKSGFDLDKILGERISRRDLLKRGTAAGAIIGLGPLLAACGGGTTTTTAAGGTTTTVGEVKKGGNLKIGLVGGGAQDTADPHMSSFIPDDAINWCLFEGLLQYSPDYTPEYLLAEDVSPNEDATVWTAKIKSDILWHDGKPFTADDVVFSFKRIVDPDNPLLGAAALGGLKSENIVKVDDMTVTFTFDEPNVIFKTDALPQRLVHVVPVGFDPANPIGTGPFKMKSFKPGEGFVLEAFADYHGGAPYLDTLTFTEFEDPTARVNALLSGAVDAICELPPSQLPVIEATAGLVALNSKSGGWVPFCMNLSVKPFDDVRVRQAFRLIVDRQQILDNAYSGVGWIGNDMYSPFDKGYPSDLPQRVQDLEKAKELLAEAGYADGLTVDLITSDAVGNGAVAQAEIFAEQAKGAGVTVNVQKVDSAVIYGDDYLSWGFSVDYWGLRNYLQQAAAGSTPDAPYNETHWENDEWYALVQEATKTADDNKRNDLIRQANTIEYNEGGYIIPTFKNQLDAHSDKLVGIEQNEVIGIPLGRWRLHTVYFK